MLEAGRRLVALAAVILSLAGCAGGRSPVDLVDEADALLKAGGLEHAAVRVEMRSLYGEALRRAEAANLSSSEEARVRSHAHFGLAMNRIWDLADRVFEILEEGGVLAALRG